MNFHVMTLFPEMIEQGVHTSITGKAIDNGIISLNAVNIRDFTKDKHRHVDDYPYGGGAGMVMQPQPVYDCYTSIVEQIKARQSDATNVSKTSGEKVASGEKVTSGETKFSDEIKISGVSKKPRVIYMTPQGTVFSQKIAESLAKEDDLIFLCGHYEGIDERVLEEIVTDYLSIGDYVLTGGELPAMVMIDTIARLVPGVLNNEESAQYESFQDGLLEYPQYTRPPVFHDKKVPEVLLTGDHIKIEKWRHQKSVERTLERRPDLFDTAVLDADGEKYLAYAKGQQRAKYICENYWKQGILPDWLSLMDEAWMQWIGGCDGHILDIGLCTGLRLKSLVDAGYKPVQWTGIEAIREGILVSESLMDAVDCAMNYKKDIMASIDQMGETPVFNGLIMKHVVDRMFQKDAKKMLKKIARLLKGGSHALIEISALYPENEMTKYAGKHMVADANGAFCNLDTDIWVQIFKPYFKIVEISEYIYPESGKCTRIFKLSRKM